ncbi:hypothetical protein BBP40_002340 [Aspergillus hancockii]|nr:hypothetical protein BBP40_002340 [Aspergillus hancockii]
MPAIAIAIAASGSSFGGVIYPIVFRQLQPQIGFSWATRALGFIALETSSISLIAIRVRQVPNQTRVLTELAAFKEPPYALFCVAMFFGYISFFGPIFYIESYAIQKNPMNSALAFYLVSILNAASIPGRAVPGLLNPYLGPINILLGSAILNGILSLC